MTPHVTLQHTDNEKSCFQEEIEGALLIWHELLIGIIRYMYCPQANESPCNIRIMIY